jgi:hypothetical protein
MGPVNNFFVEDPITLISRAGTSAVEEVSSFDTKLLFATTIASQINPLLNTLKEKIQETANANDKKPFIKAYKQLSIKKILIILIAYNLKLAKQGVGATEEEPLGFDWETEDYNEYREEWQEALEKSDLTDLNQRVIQSLKFMNIYFNVAYPFFTFIQKNFTVSLFHLYLSTIINTTLLVANRDLFEKAFIQKNLQEMKKKLEEESKLLLAPTAFKIFQETKIPATPFTLFELLEHFSQDPEQPFPVPLDINPILLDFADDLLFLTISFK